MALVIAKAPFEIIVHHDPKMGPRAVHYTVLTEQEVNRIKALYLWTEQKKVAEIWCVSPRDVALLFAINNMLQRYSLRCHLETFQVHVFILAPS